MVQIHGAWGIRGREGGRRVVGRHARGESAARPRHFVVDRANGEGGRREMGRARIGGEAASAAPVDLRAESMGAPASWGARVGGSVVGEERREGEGRRLSPALGAAITGASPRGASGLGTEGTRRFRAGTGGRRLA